MNNDVVLIALTVASLACD